MAWRIIDRSTSGKGKTLNSSIWSWTFEDSDDVGALQNPHRALNTYLMPSLPPTHWTHFYVRVFCTWLWSQGSVEHKQSTRLTQNPPLFFWAWRWCWGFTKSAWSASATHFPLIPQLFRSIWWWSWDPKLIRFHFQWWEFFIHCSTKWRKHLALLGAICWALLLTERKKIYS